MEEYAHFTNEEKGTWPSYRTIGSGTVLSGPTEANTSTYITSKYKEVGRIALVFASPAYCVEWLTTKLLRSLNTRK